MKNAAVRVLWVVAVFGGIISAARLEESWAAGPVVIETVPKNGATDVDPNLKTLRVTFDRDMSQGGYSWVGGGPKFPETRGRPSWISKRTCVLPVDLKPNHDYWVGINSRSARNFRSAEGVPAEHYPIEFRTGPTRPFVLTPELNREAIAELRKAVEEQYSYRDLHNVDWDRAFEEHTPVLEKATSLEEFAKETVELLRPSKDLHITVRYAGNSLGVHSRRVPPNMNYKLLTSAVPAFRERSRYVSTGMFGSEIGYVLINTWSADDIRAHEPAFEALDVFEFTSGIVVDVRPNSGGDEGLAQWFAGCFVDAPRVYAASQYRDPDSPDGFTKPTDRLLRPKKGRPKYRGKVAVLMGPHIMSSCEAFLLMMKQAPNCKLFGQRSYGSSGRPMPTSLSNGVTVSLPSWKALRPDGSCFEGEGIEPDVVIETTATDFTDRDPVLDAALKWLRE